MRILVVEDEKELCQTIEEGLRIDGFEVDTCYDGEDAWELIWVEKFDLIILDLNLPGMDGMEVLHKIRKENLEVNVLVLSARGQVKGRVEGLDAGANDYLCKPFAFEELSSRVRCMTRRRFVQNNIVLASGELSLNPKTRIAYAKGCELFLTRKEIGILEYLMLHPESVIGQEELIQRVWDGSVDSFSNSIRVHISVLRKKLRGARGYDPITNRVGQGYLIGGKKYD